MRSKQEIEEIKEAIEVYAERIETLNPENIGEVEEDEFQEVLKGLDTEIIEQIIKNRIPLFYSGLGYFYPFLECEPKDFKEFLETYATEMRGWYERELEFFEDCEEAETIYKIYHELFDMEEEQVDSWYDNEFDSLSWREVYISKGNGVTFLIDEGGYGNDIIIMDPEWDINEIVKRLKEGEPLYRFSQ